MDRRRLARDLSLAGLLLATLGLAACSNGKEGGQVPITTASEQARRHFLEGRRLVESLRGTDARESFQKAVEEDDSFALAHLYLAYTAPNNNEFFECYSRALALADRVSEGERLMIRAIEARVRSDPVTQEKLYRELVDKHPDSDKVAVAQKRIKSLDQ